MEHQQVLRRYRDFNGFLREYFGTRVQKITVDAGFTCPNRDGSISSQGCIYCDASGSGSGAARKRLGVAEQIHDGMAAMRRRYRAEGFLVYFQAFTNTYGPLPRLKAVYEEALEIPGVRGLCIGTRPDCVNEETLDLIASYTDRWMVWMEYGLQSALDETLHRINRGHDFRRFVEAVERTARKGIFVCAHLIIGLPGEDSHHIRATADRISSLPLHGIKLHSLYVVRGTPLERLYQQGAYIPWTQTEYAESVCDVLERIPAHWVIQRLTGDPAREQLVTPSWALQKQETLSIIRDCLDRRNTWQGRLLGAQEPDGMEVQTA